MKGLSPSVVAGPRGKSARTTGPRVSLRSHPETVKIRAWPKENGYELSDRDRVHQPVKDAYYTAIQ